MLETTWSKDGFIVNIILYHSNWHGESIEDSLLRRAYWLKTPIMGPLLVSLDDSTYSTKIDISTSGIIYALDIHSMVRFENNANVITSDTAVSASIYERM
jgi:hypothetical protein